VIASQSVIGCLHHPNVAIPLALLNIANNFVYHSIFHIFFGSDRELRIYMCGWCVIDQCSWFRDLPILSLFSCADVVDPKLLTANLELLYRSC
jgi:hypothetical protein